MCLTCSFGSAKEVLVSVCVCVHVCALEGVVIVQNCICSAIEKLKCDMNIRSILP